jgi:hypothetical protein
MPGSVDGLACCANQGTRRKVRWGMIDRYFIDSYGVESSDKLGKWVLYIDHQQVLAEKDRLIERLTQEAEAQAFLKEREDE